MVNNARQQAEHERVQTERRVEDAARDAQQREEVQRTAYIDRLTTFIRSVNPREIFDEFNNEVLNSSGTVREIDVHYLPTRTGSTRSFSDSIRESYTVPASADYSIEIKWKATESKRGRGAIDFSASYPGERKDIRFGVSGMKWRYSNANADGTKELIRRDMVAAYVDACKHLGIVS